MTRRRHHPAAPGDLEAKLLRVCFLPPAAAAAVLDRELPDGLAIDDLPQESHALLPLLHRRLVELDRRPPEMARLQGVRRRLWVQNELRLRAVRDAIGGLATAGVSAAAVGGLGVIARHLGRTDLRPIHDADLLVAAADLATGRDALASTGWTPGRPWRGGHRFEVHGLRCTDADGRSVSLRWSTAPPYDDFGEHTRTCVLGDASFVVVSDADLVMHVLLDGPRVRCSSDLLAILPGGRTPEWSRLVATATARRSGAAVAETLVMLDHVVPLRVPADTIAELAESPGSGVLTRLSRDLVRRVERRLEWRW